MRSPQAGVRPRVGLEWRGTDDYVFSAFWSESPPHARLHDLRHVHVTTLLLAGVPVHVIAARLGHSDPSITLRVYAHFTSDQLTEAADIFARAAAATT